MILPDALVNLVTEERFRSLGPPEDDLQLYKRQILVRLGLVIAWYDVQELGPDWALATADAIAHIDPNRAQDLRASAAYLATVPTPVQAANDKDIGGAPTEAAAS